MSFQIGIVFLSGYISRILLSIIPFPLGRKINVFVGLQCKINIVIYDP